MALSEHLDEWARVYMIFAGDEEAHIILDVDAADVRRRAS